MPKTHEDIIIENEDRLRRVMLSPEEKELSLLIDSNITYVNELGQTFRGFENIPLKKDYKLSSIEILSRDTVFFNSVAVSTTLEIRSGQKDGYDFITKMCITRIWKFDSRKWVLIVVTTVPC